MIRKLLVIATLMVAAMAFGQGQSNIVQDIVVSGNEHVSVEAILAAMRTKKGQPYVQSQLDQDKQTLEDMGFFEAVDVTAKAADPTGWTVRVEVQEFPVVKEIRVVGNAVIPASEILKVVTIQPGDVFNLKNIRPSSDAISALYAKKGYFAQVSDFGPMKESPNTVSITIIELTVGEVKVVGNTRTKDRVMRHLIKTRPGDPYNVKKWEADLRRIYATRWFDSVRSSENDTREPGKIDLTAEVKETKTGTFGVGLQMDPSSRFAGFIRLTDDNFKGSGQSVGLNLLQSTTGGGASGDISYGNPFFDKHDTSMSLQVYSHLIYRFSNSVFGTSTSSPTNSQYTERRVGTQLSFARPIKADTAVSIAGRFERINTDATATTIGDGFIQQDGDVIVGTAAITRNRRDADIDPARGDWIRLSAEPGWARITDIGGAVVDTSILGDHTFFKENFEYRSYWSPGQPPRKNLDDPRRVVAFRLRYGKVTGKVPFFEQYFAGGAETVRGYQEDRFWGNETLITTLEYRLPIQKSFNFITFVDYGGAWGGYGTINDFTQSKKMQMNVGYGAGLSFKTPLGPIRLDLGFDSHGKSRTHFLIGTSF